MSYFWFTSYTVQPQLQKISKGKEKKFETVLNLSGLLTKFKIINHMNYFLSLKN